MLSFLLSSAFIYGMFLFLLTREVFHSLEDTVERKKRGKSGTYFKGFSSYYVDNSSGNFGEKFPLLFRFLDKFW